MTVQTLDPAADAASPLRLFDYEPAVDDFRAAVVEGLSRLRKRVPCRFLYDERGSHLFDRICTLDEYYPTRTELAVMQRYGAEMASAIGPRCLLVEYGSGSSMKTRLLLDRLFAPAAYVPIDISRAHLVRSARALASAYPGLAVRPVCADYLSEFELPDCGRAHASVAAYFPGSTIGNFEPEEAINFLQGVRRTCGPSSGLLIGVDLKKDPALLHAAYNDAKGVTAAFNLNLLRRMNVDLGGDFDLAAFRHHACYNPRAGRMEMHLLSMADQTVTVGPRAFHFDEGESIHTENCYKFTLQQFELLALAAGYQVHRTWTDERNWFGVLYLTAT